MQKANTISAFFFLGLFSIVLLHQAFPHMHHHGDSPSSLDIINSSGQHHEDSSNENEDTILGFFGFIMDMHVHSGASSEIVVLQRNSLEQQTTFKKVVRDTSINTQSPFLIDNRQSDSPQIYHPPNTYFNPYLSRPDLRGPPSLG